MSKLVLVLGKEALAPTAVQKKLQLKHRPTFRQNYLRTALEAALIARTLPDKPNSRLQRSRLTVKGRALLKSLKSGRP